MYTGAWIPELSRKKLVEGLTTYKLLWQESIYSRQIAVLMVALCPSSWADVSHRHSDLLSSISIQYCFEV